MKRYIHLYFVYTKRAIQSRLEYKKDTIIGIFSFLLSNACSILSLAIVIQGITQLDGWGMYELGFLYGMVALIKSVDHFFADSLWNIGYWYVRRGELDKHLIRPVYPLFQILAEKIQFEALGELIMGLALMITCGCNLTITWTFEKVIVLLVSMTFGASIITGLKMITSSIALWTKKSGQVMQVVYNCTDYAKYPLSVFNGVKFVKYLLLFILPFGMAMTVPTQFILKDTCEMLGSFNGVGYALCGIIIAMSLIFNFIGIKLFNLGLDCYESVGN